MCAGWSAFHLFFLSLKKIRARVETASLFAATDGVRGCSRGVGGTGTTGPKQEKVNWTGGLAGLRWRWRKRRRAAGSKAKEELRGIMGDGRGLSADRQANLPAGATQERRVSLERRAGPAPPANN